MSRYGESEPHIHSGRIPFYRCVDEFLEFRKLHNAVELRCDFTASHSKYCAAQENILLAAQFGVETRANLDEGREVALNRDFAGGGRSDTGEQLENGAFSGPVVSNNSNYLAALYFKTQITNRPEILDSAAGSTQTRYAVRLRALLMCNAIHF